MKIGFFDSGMGGLTVLHKAMIELPFEEFLYYADVDNVPYGTKRKEEVREYSDRAVRFLIERGAKVVVVACNTATSVAIQYLREKYEIPILGMEPAVKPAVSENGGKRVMVVATPLTAREEKLKNLINQVDENHVVDIHPLSRLVPFVEMGLFGTPEADRYIADEFSTYDLHKYSVLVLGCTHFNYFRDSFAKVFDKGTKLIEGSKGTVRHLVSVLENRQLLEYGGFSVEYYLSGRRAEGEADTKRFEAFHRRLEDMLKIR